MRRSLLVLACCALLPLTSCGASTDVADGPSSAAPVLSATPTTVAPSPTVPAHESAKHFIRRWVKVNTEAQRTGDLTELNSVNLPTCESCKNFAKALRAVYDAGGVIEPTETSILWIKRHADHTYYVREHSAPSRYRETASGPWKQFAGGTATEIYTLRNVDGSWRMTNYAGLAGSSQ